MLTKRKKLRDLPWFEIVDKTIVYGAIVVFWCLSMIIAYSGYTHDQNGAPSESHHVSSSSEKM